MFLKVKDQNLTSNNFIEITRLNKKIYLKGHFFYNDILYHKNNIIDLFENNIHDRELTSLNGFFNLIVICEKTKKINIYNDRVGAVGLYYYSSKTEIIISDNIHQISSHLNSNSVDIISMMEMLRFRFTSGKYTLYEDIFKLTPASKISIDFKSKPQINISRYWDYSFKNTNNTIAQSEEEGYEILMSIMKRYRKNINEDKVALALSGGFDSRCVLGLLLKNQFTNLKTFTYGHNDCDDITIAKQIRDTYNLDSSFLSNPNYCDNLFNKSKVDKIVPQIGHTSYYMQGMYNQILLDKLDNIRYVMLGDPGFLLGIYLSKFDSEISSNQTLVKFIHNKNRAGIHADTIQKLLKDKSISNDDILNCIEERMIESMGNSDDYRIKYYKWIQENRFRNYILASQIDMNVNQNKIVLSPLYDNEFTDYLFSLPSNHYKNYKVYLNIIGKHILTDQLKKLANIKYDSRGHYRIKNDNYSPRIRHKKIKSLIKLKNKITGRYQKNDLYPLLELSRKNTLNFRQKISNLIDVNSNIFNMQEVKKLIDKNTNSKFGLKYTVMIALSAILTEDYINNGR